MLRIASGGRKKADVIQNGLKPILEHWHASIAKNAAAEFAIRGELGRGKGLRSILLCNLDGDNIMLPSFAPAIMAQTRDIEAASFFSKEIHFRPPVYASLFGSTTGRIAPKSQCFFYNI